MYELETMNFGSSSQGNPLNLLDNFEKAIIRTRTTSPVVNIYFLRTLIQGDSQCEYEVLVDTHGHRSVLLVIPQSSLVIYKYFITEYPVSYHFPSIKDQPKQLIMKE